MPQACAYVLTGESFTAMYSLDLEKNMWFLQGFGTLMLRHSTANSMSIVPHQAPRTWKKVHCFYNVLNGDRPLKDGWKHSFNHYSIDEPTKGKSIYCFCFWDSLKNQTTRWWFQILLMFTPVCGDMIQIFWAYLSRWVAQTPTSPTRLSPSPKTNIFALKNVPVSNPCPGGPYFQGPGPGSFQETPNQLTRHFIPTWKTILRWPWLVWASQGPGVFLLWVLDVPTSHEKKMGWNICIYLPGKLWRKSLLVIWFCIFCMRLFLHQSHIEEPVFSQYFFHSTSPEVVWWRKICLQRWWN